MIQCDVINYNNSLTSKDTEHVTQQIHSLSSSSDEPPGSPVQVRCTILDAWGCCTGMTQRDGTGREEGGGFRMGNTCIPVVDSC